MLIQSLAICSEMFFVAIFYVGDTLGLPMPETVTKYEHFVLLLVHGKAIDHGRSQSCVTGGGAGGFDHSRVVTRKVSF
jgi:hypothetical protein